MQIETEVELLKVKSDHCKEQFARVFSAYESEHRWKEQASKRMSLIEKDNEKQDRELAHFADWRQKVDGILLNSGRGLAFEVDRLKQAREDDKDRQNRRMAFWALGITGLNALLYLMDFLLKK